MRPSSRNESSHNFREEQSPRPARPRLSRSAVDRAWENGATPQHADYHPRQNNPRQPAQRQGRPSTGFGRPQTQRPHGYENRQEGYRSPSSPSSNRGEYRPSQEKRPEAGPRRFNESGYRTPGGSQPHQPNGERWNNHDAPQRPGYNERPTRFTPHGPGSAQRRENSPRPFDRTNGNYEHPNRGPRSFDRTNGNYEHPNRGPRSFDRTSRDHENTTHSSRPFNRSQRDPEHFTRDKRTDAPQRDNHNPRWQSRPSAQRDYMASQNEHTRPTRDYPTPQRDQPRARREYPAPREEHISERYEGAQFEGDYEHFGRSEQAPQPGQTYEKPVTHLPDGRVLKGPRAEQRKQARFWTGVQEEASTLLPPPPTEQAEPTVAPLAQEEPITPAMPEDVPATKPTRSRKTPTGGVKTVKTTRVKSSRAAGEKAEKKVPGSQGLSPRPSRKGYKWPTPPASEE